MWWRVAVLATACELLTPSTVLAQEHYNFWSFLEHNRPVTRCAEKSPEHAAASERLEQLYDRFERLQPSDNHTAAVEALQALLKTECFHLASEIQDLPQPDSMAALKDWIDRGAFDWLASYLEVPQLGDMSDLQPYVLLPPGVRPTLTLERHRDHVLAPFLCPSADPKCGSETRGWRARADAFFKGPLTNNSDAEKELSAECLSEASSEPTERRYMHWHACVQGRAHRTTSVPLGNFKAPQQGWLIISGRRGHYEFCDATSAYDLASGAAFQFESCSALDLRPDGSVDFEATNKARVKRVRSGRVSIENLREAAWMLLVAPYTTPIRLYIQEFPLPPGLEQRIFAHASPMFMSGISWNTGMSTLSWRLVGAAGGSYSGELTWPRAYQAAGDHSAGLVEVFESGLAEGCAPQSPPTLARVDATGRGELADDYRAAFAEWRSLKPCRTAPR